ncbi:MAG: glycosyl hydrolase [Bacteroidales bacterium]|nr:glycosyl hydrolase [Bacteroidales bacterium]
MKPIKAFLLYSLFTLSFVTIAQIPVPVGAGSYASYPPDSVIDEGSYFAKSYRQLHDGYPFYLHERMQNQPVATNEWFSHAIFSQYTGELWVYPQMIEGHSQGITVSAITGFETGGTRAVNTKYEASLTLSGIVDIVDDGTTKVMANFENGSFPNTWELTGDFLNYNPRTLEEHNHSGTPENYLGDYYFDSFFTGDANMGTASSPFFTVENDYLHFMIAGGNGEGAEIRLLSQDSVVFRAKANNSMTFAWVTWDLSSLQGQQVKIVIADETPAGWGFIACDNFVLSNKEKVGSSFSSSFWPEDAKAYDWSETGFTFSLFDDQERGMLASVVHGVPFTYIDITDVKPIINTSQNPSAVYDATGQVITSFPYTGSTLILEINNELFGLHAPANTQFSLDESKVTIVYTEAATHPYLVISNIPKTSLIATYDDLARNKITNSEFQWDVDMSIGKIKTTFKLETENYDSGAKEGASIMSFIPHQWRNTTTNFSYIEDANYISVYGDMKSGTGNAFTFAYDFGGMPPFMPKPLNFTAEQEERMNALITERAAVSEGFNGNTYAKGLGEESTIMLMARELGHQAYSTLKENLKTELIDWFTFDQEESTEKSYYFAEYPDYGAIIGFPPGYGSQGFNDLHFHNGYFIIGAARLMMVDPEFKAQYGEMAKLVARSYASWLRYGEKDNVKLPLMRNFDPYFGHSFAGGTGDGGGNNQESTSEALNSWFGIYALGVALNDQEILEMGATGFMLEGKTADLYWMNKYDDIPEEYPCDYVGILRTSNLAMATYFSGDPAWAFGIQFVPSDHYYNYVYDGDSAHYQAILESMIQDRITMDEGYFTHADIYDNIVNLGAYLGGYVLNFMQTYSPKTVANMLDSLYINEGGEWTTHVNVATNYYVANANLTYGHPARGYYTSSATSSVFRDRAGELVYVLYNGTEQGQDIVIYNDEKRAIDTITVAAGAMYNSKETTPAPSIHFYNIEDEDIFIQYAASPLKINVSDKDKNITSVELYMENELVENFITEPYTYEWTPGTTGTITLIAKVSDANGQSDADTVNVVIIENNQAPYNETAFTVPATIIPAVEWDRGGELIAYEDKDDGNSGAGVRLDENVDTEGGNGLSGNIGWVRKGEWLEYSINVAEAKNYDVVVNYTSAYGGAKFYLSFDGIKTASESPTQTQSWADYQDYVVQRIPLEAGEQVMRIYFEEDGMNLKSFSFKVNTDTVISSSVERQSRAATVSPNPCFNTLNLEWGDEQFHRVHILSISGTVIYNKDIDFKTYNSNLKIDMSSYYSGIYFIVLSNNDKQAIYKILKQ